MTVETLCKHTTISDEDPTKSVDLGYEYAFMQKLMDSQLKDHDKTPTKREIKAQVKTQLRRLIPNLAENLTFNSLSPPSSFKTSFYHRKPYKETGSWYSMLYEGTNLVLSNNVKGVFILFNKEVEKHNWKVFSEAMEKETAEYDDELITPLEESQINRSYYTYVNDKGNTLAFTEKGISASWPQMNASKNMTHVTKSAERW